MNASSLDRTPLTMLQKDCGDLVGGCAYSCDVDGSYHGQVEHGQVEARYMNGKKTSKAGGICIDSTCQISKKKKKDLNSTRDV